MRLLRYPILALLLGAASCDSTSPNELTGAWSATTFTYTQSGQPSQDVVALGGGLVIIIMPDTKTTGVLTIPGSLIAGGVTQSYSMDGVAVRNGNTVQFSQAAETFVHGVDWTLTGTTMTATKVAGGVTINVTLTHR
jgi:hypothetical protein